MSFKHFFRTHFTESEIKANFTVLNESRWWGKFSEDRTSILEYKDKDKEGKEKTKTFKVCKMDEDGSGPAYVLEARGGARYGLFRATEGNFHCIRMKSGKKHLIKPKGIFREVEGKLVFELHGIPKGAQQIGGGKELIQKAVANKKKEFNPEATLSGGRPNLDVRPGQGMPKADAPFDPEKTMEENISDAEPPVVDQNYTGAALEETSNDEIGKGINKYLADACHFTPKQIRNWWTTTDTEDISMLWSEKVEPWLAGPAPSVVTEEIQVFDEPDSTRLAMAHDAKWKPNPTEVADFSKSAYTPAQVGQALKKGYRTAHPYKFFVANDNAVYRVLSYGNFGGEWLGGIWAVSKTDLDPTPYLKERDPEQLKKVAERRATAEPDKSFPNGEPTFDKNTDEWNKGVYTDAKA